MSYQEKLNHWTACVASRMNSIREIEKSTKNIIDVWPQYKDPDGFRLVCFLSREILVFHPINTTYVNHTGRIRFYVFIWPEE